MSLTAEDLLAGSALTHVVEVPAGLAAPGSSAPASTAPGGAASSRTKGDGSTGPGAQTPQTVSIRPLTVRDVQLVAHAARDDSELAASLMISHALVEPTLTAEEVARLPAGLARFLVDQINELSGIDTPSDRLAELVQAPLAKACFVLADEFGWTAEDVTSMTIGQILMYLEMAGQASEVA